MPSFLLKFDKIFITKKTKANLSMLHKNDLKGFLAFLKDAIIGKNV